jgi:phosphatidate cytidylyltransferase
MLRQRVLTALVMAGVFLAAILFLPPAGLALLFGAIVALGGWEWSRLAGWQSNPARALFVLLLLAALGALYVYCRFGEGGFAEVTQRKRVQPLLGVACLWWSVALLWIKSYPASAALWGSRLMRSLIGLLTLVPAWLAAVFLLSYYPRGGMLMVVLVVVVAAADIGAYFSGKRWGRHKFAPDVSPAKTWQGFWGGLLGCAVLAVLLWRLLPAQAAHVSLPAVVAVTLTTALASVVGDLSVSMVKRQSGAKDSGSLLPGHGGVLDRLDSICGAAPVFALGLLLAGW